MGPYLESVVDVMLDRSPQEWVVAIVIALGLALAVSGAHMLFRRWVPTAEDPAPLVGMAVVAIFSGMVVTGTYLNLEKKRNSGPGIPSGSPGSTPGPAGRGPWMGGGRGRGEGFTTRLSNEIFDRADDNHDGLLSPEEAAGAAGRYVEEVEKNRKGSLTREALIEILRERMRPSGSNPPSPPPPASPSPAADSNPAPNRNPSAIADPAQGTAAGTNPAPTTSP